MRELNPDSEGTKSFSCKLSADGKVEISPLDTREYRFLQLPNELNVLLLSDPLSDKAAAAMDVSVGSFSDPSKLPGLAHFCEHMLFLGTEKYRDEDSYRKFLAENSGMSNAYTARENTNYHFQLVVPPNDLKPDQPEHVPRFKQALDMFSQFFIAPLFTESATERELNAVDSEHEKNLHSDGNRIYQVELSLGNPEHPYSRFATGSKETLGPEAGYDTRAELLAFHEKYYSANIMNLCICGPYSVEVLEKWTVELFSQIKNKKIEHPSAKFESIKPRLSSSNGQLTYIASISNVRTLEVTWVIPPIKKSYRSKPAFYLAHLLGHEGKGSLLSVLKAKQWANQLAAGPCNDAHAFTLFSVNMDLTEEGVDNVEQILELMFGYLRLIQEKGVQLWIHDETSQLSKVAFYFQERAEPLNFVQRISSTMEKYPPLHFVTGPSLLWDYDSDGIQNLLTHLTPKESCVYLITKDASTDKINQKEKWYGTPYGVEKISDEKLEFWSQIGPDPALDIPPKNEFIPMDFQLLANPLPDGKFSEEGPKIVDKNEHYELHYLLDRNFNRPKVNVSLSFETNMAYMCPRFSVLTKLFTELLIDDLTEFTYDADIAGLKYSFYNTMEGMRLTVHGYNDKLKSLLQTIVDRIANFTVNPERFPLILDSIERQFENFDKEQPYQHALYSSSYLMEQPRWHIQEYLATINEGEITVNALKIFVPDLLRRMYIVALVCGNASEEWATSIMKATVDTLQYKPLPRTELTVRRVMKVPTEYEVVTRKTNANLEDSNSAVEMCFQFGRTGDFAKDVKIDLLSDILNKPAFHELRTVQQLGYIVFEGIQHYVDVRVVYIIVQSTVAGPDELRIRIREFLGDFRQTCLSQMTEAEFKSYVDSLVQLKAEPEKNLVQQCARFWNEIQYRSYEYQRAQREIEALKNVKLQDVVDLFDEYIAESGLKRRCLTSMIHGKLHPVPDLDNPATSGDDDSKNKFVEVRDPSAFRNLCETYPVCGSSIESLGKPVKFWS